jgi:RNA polymerase sigma-70 factor (ECF subfamily)
MDTSLSLLERLAGRPSDDDWRRLVDLYLPLLRAWTARAGVSASDADDLAQEVLLVVFREVGAFERRGPGAFRAWLRAILLHRVQHHFRSRRHAPAAVSDSELSHRLDELSSPQSELSRLWDREHDEYVVASLLKRVQADFADATWQAFRRYVLDAVPAAQVADELGLSLNSVLLAKSRVLARVRAELVGLVEA